MSHAENSNTALSKVSNELQGFARHNLRDQNSASLMDRIDNKYLMPVSILGHCLQELHQDYSILAIDDRCFFTYENTYFDDDSLSSFNQHHNGKLARYKTRHRRYLETNTEFFEIKFKNNKRRTIKERVQLTNLETAIVDSNSFALSLLAHTLEHKKQVPALSPQLHVNYHRVTLLNRNAPERLTLDFDLRFCKPGETDIKTLPSVVIAEHKYFGKQTKSSFVNFTKSERIRTAEFSKYCIGNCLTRGDSVKGNRFKPHIRHLKKIMEANIS